MRNTNVMLIIALALALVASLTLNQASLVSAQQGPPVGVVVDYVPGQSITIVDQSGVQQQYAISSTLKILPPGRADALAVGSFVTIIAPASLGDGRQTAVGIVVHPHIPNGWNTMPGSPTPVASNTPEGTFTATGTITATATATGTLLATDIATATATPTVVGTATSTSTATPSGGSMTAVSTNSLINWLKSLFRQMLSDQ